jgi:hypothetical protein
MLSSLEAQMEIHREKEAHHAREEEAHREQRAAHAAELAALARHYEALKSSVDAAAPLASRYAPEPEPPKERPREVLSSSKPIIWSRLVERVVGEMAKGEEMTPASMAAAVDRRYQGLPHAADPRVISTILRRLTAYGWVRRARKGTSHRQATYVKV